MGCPLVVVSVVVSSDEYSDECSDDSRFRSLLSVTVASDFDRRKVFTFSRVDGFSFPLFSSSIFISRTLLLTSFASGDVASSLVTTAHDDDAAGSTPCNT